MADDASRPNSLCCGGRCPSGNLADAVALVVGEGRKFRPSGPRRAWPARGLAMVESRWRSSARAPRGPPVCGSSWPARPRPSGATALVKGLARAGGIARRRPSHRPQRPVPRPPASTGSRHRSACRRSTRLPRCRRCPKNSDQPYPYSSAPAPSEAPVSPCGTARRAPVNSQSARRAVMLSLRRVVHAGEVQAARRGVRRW